MNFLQSTIAINPQLKFWYVKFFIDIGDRYEQFALKLQSIYNYVVVRGFYVDYLGSSSSLFSQ